MVVLVKIIQLILALSILVVVHEFGHFITARIFKTRVEKFYIFFNPNFSLFRCKKVHGQWRFAFFSKNVPEKYITHERIDPITNKKETTYEEIDLSTLSPDDWRTDEDTTEFGIGWIPLGGYCKIAGMIDESMDLEQMKKPAQDWEFRSKPAWQRLIVMVGGVVMNVITAYIIFTGLLISQGSQYLPTSEVNKYGIVTSQLAQEFGLRDGDKILNVNGNNVENFFKIPMELLLEDSEYIEVERNGEKVIIDLPEDAVTKLVNSNSLFISYRFPFVISDFAPGSIAQKAGMQKGDRIIKINDIDVPFFSDFSNNIAQFANQKINIAAVRDNDTLNFDIQLADDAKIGVFTADLEYK
ncbi:MAG: site-2 protease family protein, partial [Bacteroidales bacterium]|nr:site-2 protease family protein [Bacteroidales bacterium]